MAETTHFEYTPSATADTAVLTHFWLTGAPDCVDNSQWRYYIDQEESASISIQPAQGMGVGFGDESAP